MNRKWRFQENEQRRVQEEKAERLRKAQTEEKKKPKGKMCGWHRVLIQLCVNPCRLHKYAQTHTGTCNLHVKQVCYLIQIHRCIHTMRNETCGHNLVSFTNKLLTRSVYMRMRFGYRWYLRFYYL